MVRQKTANSTVMLILGMMGLVELVAHAISCAQGR